MLNQMNDWKTGRNILLSLIIIFIFLRHGYRGYLYINVTVFPIHTYAYLLLLLLPGIEGSFRNVGADSEPVIRDVSCT
jgi:hypothetical protein